MHTYYRVLFLLYFFESFLKKNHEMVQTAVCTNNSGKNQKCFEVFLSPVTRRFRFVISTDYLAVTVVLIGFYLSTLKFRA